MITNAQVSFLKRAFIFVFSATNKTAFENGEKQPASAIGSAGTALLKRRFILALSAKRETGFRFSALKCVFITCHYKFQPEKASLKDPFFEGK